MIAKALVARFGQDFHELVFFNCREGSAYSIIRAENREISPVQTIQILNRWAYYDFKIEKSVVEVKRPDIFTLYLNIYDKKTPFTPHEGFYSLIRHFQLAVI